MRVRIAQSVQRLATGWTEFNSQAEAENFSLHHCIQTASGAHPTSYPMGTGGSFSGIKAAGREV
jgi:hypothetical protein